MQALISRYRTFFLLGAGFLLFILGLGSYDLIAPDEPRFALVAREMIDSGNFLFPHRNERAYPDKPPLFFWSIAATSLFTGGVNAWSARLPSALAALTCLFLIARWGSGGRWNSTLGISVMVILASCLQFIQQAHNAQIDMLLCALVTGASLLGYRRLQGETVSQVGIGLLLGLAILAKGPVGYIVPAGTWAIYCLFSGKDSWKYYPYRALLWGLLPPFLWIAGLTLQVWQKGAWDYWNNLLFKQTIVRYATPWHHHKPFYYFLTTQLSAFFPWSLFLLFAVPWKKAQRASLSSKLRFAWAAYLFILVFFSLSAGKRNLYILALYPFSAYIVAQYLLTISKPNLALKSVLIFSGTLFTVLGAALIAVTSGAFELEVLQTIDKPLPAIGIITCAVFIILGGLSGIRSAFAWKRGLIPVGFAISIFSLSILMYSVFSPWHNERRSSRDFSEKVTAYLASSSEKIPLGMVDFRSAFRFYGSQKIEELSTLSPTEVDPKLIGLPNPVDFWRLNPNGIIIIRSKHLDEFTEAKIGFPQYETLLDQLISDERFLLLARKQDA